MRSGHADNIFTDPKVSELGGLLGSITSFLTSKPRLFGAARESAISLGSFGTGKVEIYGTYDGYDP